MASTHLKLANEVANQVSIAGGSFGIYNAFVGGTAHFSEDDRLVGGIYLGHVDGPFDHPDDFRKIAGELRYRNTDDAANGYAAR